MKNYKNDDAKKSAMGFLGLALALGAMALMTGCGAVNSKGIRAHASFGIGGEDEYHERSDMHRNTLPLKCYLWADCGRQAPEDVQGS